ncbi:hypothetical protein J1605_004476 [Eschrichtius robustus]|uniref:Uncharacterized protein n=1 Tax=Eschrichtius robustus TaxID=9764 RepID=A0AB34HE44_ESCRO|nr:hypothetical protein J1605_004476 [Eschrichtius robustus]
MTADSKCLSQQSCVATEEKCFPGAPLWVGLLWWHSGWESACQCRGHGFEPWSRNIPHAAEQLSPHATTTEGHMPRARALQQEKPPNEKPVHHNEE